MAWSSGSGSTSSSENGKTIGNEGWLQRQLDQCECNLDLACELGLVHAVKHMCEVMRQDKVKGYNYNPFRYNNDPIHIAAKYGRIEVVAYLCTTTFCNSGNTLTRYDTSLVDTLLVAARNHHFGIVRYLYNLKRKNQNQNQNKEFQNWKGSYHDKSELVSLIANSGDRKLAKYLYEKEFGLGGRY